MTDKVFCPELWQRIFVLQLNEKFIAKPCCYASPSNLNHVDILDSTIIFQTYNQSDKIQQLRDQNLNGHWDSGCHICLHAEQSTGSSGRTRALDQYDSAVPLSSYVDLNLGNLCNLACAICDPNSSTSWVPLWKKIHNHEWDQHLRYQTKNRPIINDPAWFQNIKLLQLQGGEVFLQSAYTDFFTNLQRHRDLKEIQVRIFTNGTVLPSKELFNLLNQCKQVDLFFSIDDIEQRFEYQRFGAQWSKVIDNLRWFNTNCQDHWHLGIHPTYSLLNIYYLKELVEYFQQEFPTFSRTYGPYHIGTGPCSAHILPEKIKTAIINQNSTDELQFIDNFITAQEIDLTDFVSYITAYDRSTGQNYSAAHPEFWQVISS